MPYSVGDSVTGTVTGVTAYGAFVGLEGGVTGMIQISKLSDSFISDINSVIKKGDTVTARIISIDNGRIALSMIADKPKKPKYEHTNQRDREPTDFESMLSHFKSASDEKLARLNRDKKRRR